MGKGVKLSWVRALNTLDAHLRISVITLYQHYFPADNGGSFGEGWRDDLGEEVEV